MTSESSVDAKKEIGLNNRMTKRVIAPFVRIVRKKKLITEEEPKPKIHRNLSAFLLDSFELAVSLHETCEVLKEIVKANSFTLYLTDPSSNEVYECRGKTPINDRYKVKWRIETNTIVAAHVASKKEYIMIDDVLMDERFPEGIGYEVVGDSVKSVMSVPVISPDEYCYAVLEFYRNIFDPPFNRHDLELLVMCASLVGISIYENQQNLALQRQQDLNNYLSDLTKYYFEDLDVMEKMTQEIIKNVKDTLMAERASVYILLNGAAEGDELMADLYEESDSRPDHVEKIARVRFGKERAIAGIVAKTGKRVNLKDAYVDVMQLSADGTSKGGFIIRSILCMPIMGDGKIVGVIQAANKANGGYFSATDERLLNTFTEFQALVLNCTQITTERNERIMLSHCYDKLLKKVYVPCIHDVVNFERNIHNIHIPEGIGGFSFYLGPNEEDIIPQLCFNMFTSLIPESELNLNDLMRFILTVRKFYMGKLPHHNFEHAFIEFHCMYLIIRKNKKMFTSIEIKALLISALCFDIDHYGYTNNYLRLIHDDLSVIYFSSIMEHHHYDITKFVLNQFRIFKNMTEFEYTQLLEEIEKAILSSNYHSCYLRLEELQTLYNTKSFNWVDPKHKDMIKSLMVIASVFSHGTKQFVIGKKASRTIIEELLNESDLIKSMDLCPLQRFDRVKGIENHLPIFKSKFLRLYVIPCMTLLHQILPNTQGLFSGALMLRQAWEGILQVKGRKCWRQDNSIVRK